MTTSSPRIVVAMSGGVDSSLAAVLLKEQGLEPIGVTLQLRSCDEAGRSKSCCGADGIASARAVAAQIGIPHYVLDRHEQFEELVLRPAWSDYGRGRTPSPCVLCNRWIKFGLLLDAAESLGARKIATGHYARLISDPDGAIRLYRGTDRIKDQSYFLFALDERMRAAAAFPLGGFTKPQVREMARARGLPAAEKKESQDACFVSEGADFAETLRMRFGSDARIGVVADAAGREIGSHKGIHHFTIGQRRGFGISLGRPAWVKSIDAESARVVVTTRARDLLSSGLVASGVVWHETPRAMEALVQIRSRHDAAPATVGLLPGNRLLVRFLTPQRAVTPGQAAVFYDGGRVVGGGWIESAISD